MQVVHLDQRNAGGVVHPTHNGGVIPRWQENFLDEATTDDADLARSALECGDISPLWAKHEWTPIAETKETTDHTEYTDESEPD